MKHKINNQSAQKLRTTHTLFLLLLLIITTTLSAMEVDNLASKLEKLNLTLGAEKPFVTSLRDILFIIDDSAPERASDNEPGILTLQLAVSIKFRQEIIICSRRLLSNLVARSARPDLQQQTCNKVVQDALLDQKHWSLYGIDGSGYLLLIPCNQDQLAPKIHERMFELSDKDRICENELTLGIKYRRLRDLSFLLPREPNGNLFTLSGWLARKHRDRCSFAAINFANLFITKKQLTPRCKTKDCFKVSSLHARGVAHIKKSMELWWAITFTGDGPAASEEDTATVQSPAISKAIHFFKNNLTIERIGFAEVPAHS